MFSSGSGNTEGAGRFLLHDASADAVRMLVDTDGNVGIGNTVPLAKLDVTSEAAPAEMQITGNFVGNYKGVMANVQTGATATVTGVHAVAQSPSTTYGVFSSAAGATSSDNYGVYSYSDNSGAGNAYGVYGEIEGNGNLYAIYGETANVMGSGTKFAGYFNGDVTVTGTFTNPSDRKLKSNIRNSDFGLNTINQLRPVTYEYKSAQHLDMSFVSGEQIGFIAQEVEKILPSLVQNNKHPTASGTMDYKGLNYIGLIPVLTKAIQEQQDQIEEKEERIVYLENQNLEMASKLNELTAQLNEVKNLVQTVIIDRVPQKDSQAEVMPLKVDK